MICTRCGHPIAITTADPAIVTSLGKMHEACNRLAWKEANERAVERAAESTRRRSESGRRAYERRMRKEEGEG